MSTAVETSNPTVILSEAQGSREDLNQNVISTEVQRSGEISAEPDGDEIIDEAALEEKYSELESVRESAETIDAEMADLSYLENKKKKAEPQELSAEEKKTQKQKQAEERKRKRQEENDLFARRYKAKSINAAVAQSSPIIYFYNKAKQLYAHEIWEYDKSKIYCATKNGYKVLVIWESEYNEDFDKTLNKCIQFLND